MNRFRPSLASVTLLLATLFLGVQLTCRAEDAPGDRKESANATDRVTFSTDIARIVHDKCSNCHRPGQSGPFTLITYEDVRQRAETIQQVLAKGYMPPWKPIPSGIEFAHDRRLTPTQLKLFEQWINAGCPEGDSTRAPAPPEFPDGWSLGKPDLVLKMDRPFKIPADGPDIYRSFVMPLDLPDEQWVKAIELRPTARGAFHHALFFIDTDRVARQMSANDGQPGFNGMNFLRGQGNALERMPEGLARGLGGYVPGAMPNRLPGDLARRLPKRSDIVIQTHFHPTGKVEYEQTEMALYLADKAPKQQLVGLQIPPLFGMAAGIDIPAGEANFKIADSFTLPVDVRGIEIGGHAHYICREMKLVARLPSGESLDLLRIDDWDLDWQDQYIFAEPIDLPKGTELKVSIVYDNSVANPENPFSPPRPISWGRQSTDEMGSITLLTIAKEESDRPLLEQAIREKTLTALRQRVQAQQGRLKLLLGSGNGGVNLLQLLDQNRDGRLQASELPERFRDRLLDLLDKNNDNELEKSELEEGRAAIQKFIDANEKGTKS